MYKTVEIRASRCQQDLWVVKLYDVLFYSVVGTVWCSHAQMVKYAMKFRPLEPRYILFTTQLVAYSGCGVFRCISLKLFFLSLVSLTHSHIMS